MPKNIEQIKYEKDCLSECFKGIKLTMRALIPKDFILKRIEKIIASTDQRLESHNEIPPEIEEMKKYLCQVLETSNLITGGGKAEEILRVQRYIFVLDEVKKHYQRVWQKIRKN